MLINDFINVVKRERRYGTFATIVNGVVTSGTITDQPTFDILNEVNIRRKRIWLKWDWKWMMEELAIPVVPGTVKYGVTSKSGNAIDRIKYLFPTDPSVNPPVSGDEIIELEPGEFNNLTQSQGITPAVPNVPRRYMNRGQNAAGQWQITIWPSPPVAFTISGFAKGILKTFTLADLTAGTAFDYFPDGVVEDVLLDGVSSGVLAIQGQEAEAARLDMQFESKCKLLVGEQAGVARDNSPITSPPPDYYTSRQRMRSKRGTGVY